jgi:hypothetical protein
MLSCVLASSAFNAEKRRKRVHQKGKKNEKRDNKREAFYQGYAIVHIN